LIAVAASLTVGIMLGVVLSSNLLVPRSLLSSANSKDQALTISGIETIKVLAPNGHVISTWQGPDPLTKLATNVIASCATAGNAPGSTTTPYGFNSCSSWVNEILVQWDSPAGNCGIGLLGLTDSYCSYASTSSSDTLTPVGCNPTVYNSGGNYCTGWIAEATFGPATFTQANCDSSGTTPASCNVENVVAGAGGLTVPLQSTLCIRNGCENYVIGAVFDTLCTTAYAQYAVDEYPACTLASPPATMSAGDSLLVTIQFTVS